MKAITLTSLILSAVIGYSAEAQNLILNGSFESPVIPNNTDQFITPTSWTVGISVLLVNGNGGKTTLPLPQDGQQYVSPPTSPAYTLSQTFTVTNQGEYLLRWFDSTGHEAGSTSAPYSVAVLTGTLQTVASTNLEAYHPEDWRERSMRMTLSPGIYTLRFTPAGNGPGGLSPLFDNVSIIQQPTLALQMYAGLTISGQTGVTYQIQYSTNLNNPTNWVALTNLTLPSSPYLFFDATSSSRPASFYRALLLP